MVYIASLSESEYAPGKDIAEAVGVSTTYLSKVLQILVRAGFLKSVTGPRGGFALARDAKTVSLLEIMEATDVPIMIRDRCMLGLSDCSDANPCPFHGDWKKHREELMHTIKSTTLADAVKKSWPRYRAPASRHPHF